MPVRLNSSGGGSVTLDVPSTASAFNLTLPAANGNLGINLATAQNSTSGTFIDFTGIPAGVRRVTIMFSGISTNGSSNLQIQLGAGSFTTSGYASAAHQFSNANASSTTGLLFTAANSAAALTFGTMVISTLGSNIWTEMFGSAVASGSGTAGGGGVTLSGTLDRVRITTVNGTDLFDAGSINVAWEF